MGMLVPGKLDGTKAQYEVVVEGVIPLCRICQQIPAEIWQGENKYEI